MYTNLLIRTRADTHSHTHMNMNAKYTFFFAFFTLLAFLYLLNSHLINRTVHEDPPNLSHKKKKMRLGVHV